MGRFESKKYILVRMTPADKLKKKQKALKGRLLKTFGLYLYDWTTFGTVSGVKEHRLRKLKVASSEMKVEGGRVEL